MEFLSIAAILGYVIVFALLASRMLHPDGPDRTKATIAGAVAVALHGIVLADAIFLQQGQNFSLTNTSSLMVWVIALAITTVLPRIKVIVVAPAVYCLAVLSVVALWWLPPEHITNFEAKPAVWSHVIISLMAYATLMLAALYALQLNGINKRLKDRQLMLNSPMPPLLTVEKQLYHFIWVGFMLLTVGLLTGWIFLDNFLGDGQGHKATISMIAWAMYAGMLLQHHTRGVRVRTAVAYSLSGAALLTLAYFGSRIVKELILT
ncbi:cytochrome C assembly family protein [Ferrimonas lipolytica]|uniref:Cytochrome c biogenesis protein CcsA n=1 Tax=Ferrimonas lipolytica TaxID=2724191 RepID=A0A6H1UCJ5_9GAMM|nr:cytochrome c biogenesis protein CcsA [Ferrimonas lipolytica]QIZ75532.1 cytochrome c biogenesis protein CcsA [Ferrimonas lipolytica]